MKKPELLAPAGDFEKLKFAILYGTDAVYGSGKEFSLRQFSKNFSEEELPEGTIFRIKNRVKNGNPDEKILY